MLPTRIVCTTIAAALLMTASHPVPANLNGEALPKPLLRVDIGQRRVDFVQYSPDGKKLAAAADTTATLCDATTGKRLLTLEGHTRGLAGLAFTPRGKRVVTASLDGTVRVWDTATGEAAIILCHGRDPERDWVMHLSCSPAGASFASGGIAPRGGSGVRVWDARTGKPRTGFVEESVNRVAFSGDGRRLASADLHGTVRVWEVGSGQEALTLPWSKKAVTCLAWSPDSRRLAVASIWSIRVWDFPTGKEALWIPQRVNEVVFTPGGRRLLSVADRLADGPLRQYVVGELRVWDTKTGGGRLVLQFGEQENGTGGLCLSPCGTRLATGHGDGKVRIWSVEQLLGRGW
jgi:WD40 repeat protein